ncbi:MAG: hypothetical protein A3I66_04595 [Burkholderiales bacterium RIFCSPLOWO2_02_FULL_57_36]|nr:MAG: hypothetical protein A3I66_04595 [Burkholderiales bacterium RIFCSPLOWO2_02_FULL_57_36]
MNFSAEKPLKLSYDRRHRVGLEQTPEAGTETLNRQSAASLPGMCLFAIWIKYIFWTFRTSPYTVIRILEAERQNVLQFEDECFAWQRSDVA